MSTKQLPSMNGATVLLRTKDAVYIRLPRDLAHPIAFGCSCDYCKAHPGEVPRWDTLLVPRSKPTKGNDYVSTVHMPDFVGFIRAMRLKGQLR